MAFNSDFIQATNLNAVKVTATSSSNIGGHVLSNGLDNSLTLAGLSGVMTVTELNSSVVNADSLMVCPAINPSSTGVPIEVGANFEMGGNSLTGVDGISTFTNGLGTYGQVLKTDGTKSFWATDATGNIGVWASYPASQNVNMNTYNIENGGTISGTVIYTGAVNCTSLKDQGDNVILVDSDLDMANDGSILNLLKLDTAVNAVIPNKLLGTDEDGNLLYKDSLWSTEPATSTVNLDGNAITNGGAIGAGSINVTSVSTLSLNEPVNNIISVTADLDLNSTQTLKSVLSLTTASNVSGTEGQVLSADASGFLVWADSSADASTWSTFPATQDVDMDFNSLTDVQLLQAREGEVTGIENFTYIDNLGTNIDVQCDLTIADTKSLITSNIKSLTQASNDPVLVSSNLAVAPTFLVQTDGIKSQTPSGGIEVQSALNFMGGAGTITNIDVLSTINEGAGGDGQVLTSVDGLTTWANPVTASNWSTYDASTNVDMANYNIENAGTVDANILIAPIISSTGGSLTVTDGSLSIKSGANTTFQIESGGLFQIRGNGGQFFMYDTSDSTATILASTASNFFNSNNQANMTGWGTISSQRLNPVVVNENTYYVSPHGIDGGNTVGSFEYPFQTIQFALGVTEALTAVDNEYRYIKVMAGTYSGAITITKKVYLQGQANTPFEAGVGCQISGAITVTIDDSTSTLFNNGVYISGFLIGSVVTFDSSVDSMLNIDNCYIYTPDNASGRGVYFNPSATNGRLRITNTQIVSGGVDGLEPLVELTKSGSLIMNNCIINSKGVQNCLKFSGTATCDTVNYVKFESDTSSASASPIVEITSTNSASHAFANCGFIYGSSTSKTANANASGILCNSASGNPSVVSTYNTFILAGTNGSNYAIQDLKAGTANVMVCLFYMNGATPNNAYAINATNAVNKFQLVTVS